MKWFTLIVVLAVLLLGGCKVAKDTAATTEGGGAGAAGIADKMHGGTVGDTNEDTGESGSEESGE